MHMPMRALKILSAYNRIFSEKALESHETNLEELINWYYVNIYPEHLAAYETFFGFKSDDSGLNVKNLQAANFFGQGTGEGKKEEEFVYRIYEGEELEFSQIMRSPKDPTTVGWYAVGEGNIVVIASLGENVKPKPVGQPKLLGHLLIKLLEAVLDADQGNDIRTKARITVGG